MHKVYARLQHDGWRRAAQTLGVFLAYLATQAGVQAINTVTGLVIIRTLSKDGYAAYTIINTLGPAMLMLSDNGITTGLNAIGRKVWRDDFAMGALVNTGLRLRSRFAIFSFLVVAPFLAWTLFTKSVPVVMIVLLTAAIVMSVTFQISTNVMRTVLELRQDIRTLGLVSLGSTVLRLALVAALALLLHLDAFSAMVAAVCAIGCEAALIARSVRKQVAWNAPANPEYLPTIFSKVRQTMPLTVYYCIQGQLSIWLISVFGSAAQVADIGSASRLSVLYATLVTSFSTIVLPRFARNNGRRRLHALAFQIVGAAALMLAGVVLLTWLVPQPFVWLLGDKYRNMSGLIWLVILAQGLSSLAGVVYGLNLSKGWIPSAWITIPVEIVTQVVLLLTLDLRQTANVLIFTCLGAIPPMLVTFGLLLRRLREEPE
jgi:O-antigen/teichoic acid export membrane protein